VPPGLLGFYYHEDPGGAKASQDQNSDRRACEVLQVRPLPGSQDFVPCIPGSNPAKLLLSLPSTASAGWKPPPDSTLQPNGVRPLPENGSEGVRGGLCGRGAAAVRDSDILSESSIHYQASRKGRGGRGAGLHLRRAAHGALRRGRLRAGEMAH